MVFRWHDWNIEHIGKHGIEPREAEYVVRHARPPYPREAGNLKYEVFGRTRWGAVLHVVFFVDVPASEREGDKVLYVVHAREATDREKRRYRKAGQ